MIFTCCGDISGRDMSLDFSHTKYVEGIEEREKFLFTFLLCQKNIVRPKSIENNCHKFFLKLYIILDGWMKEGMGYCV